MLSVLSPLEMLPLACFRIWGFRVFRVQELRLETYRVQESESIRQLRRCCSRCELRPHGLLSTSLKYSALLQHIMLREDLHNLLPEGELSSKHPFNQKRKHEGSQAAEVRTSEDQVLKDVSQTHKVLKMTKT